MIPELVCRKRSATYVRTRCAEPAPFTQGAFLFGAMQSFFAEGGWGWFLKLCLRNKLVKILLQKGKTKRLTIVSLFQLYLLTKLCCIYFDTRTHC